MKRRFAFGVSSNEGRNTERDPSELNEEFIMFAKRKDKSMNRRIFEGWNPNSTPFIH